MWAAVWRVGLAVALLVVLLAAQLGRHDDWFPLGMLGQYAAPRDPDGEVLSTYLVGISSDGRTVPIELGATTAGLTRVELETHLPELEADPGLLAEVARTVESHSPGLDLVALLVRQEVFTLRDGAVSGPAQIRDLITWEEP